MDYEISILRISDVETDTDCLVCRHFRILTSSSFALLRISSDSGCVYCNILWQALSIRGRDAVDCGDGDELFFYSKVPLFRLNIQFRTASGSEDLETFRVGDKLWPAVDDSRTDHSYQLPKASNLPITSSQHVSGNISSKAHLHHARKWLGDCLRNHGHCRVTTISSEEPLPMLPKRIIDVTPLDETGAVRLLESGGMRSLYLCLSHCWGSQISRVDCIASNILGFQRLSEMPSTSCDG
jgi:hypothetical protein